MFELERLKLDQQNLEDLIRRSEFEFDMVEREHERELEYLGMQWQEIEIERLKY